MDLWLKRSSNTAEIARKEVKMKVEKNIYIFSIRKNMFYTYFLFCFVFSLLFLAKNVALVRGCMAGNFFQRGTLLKKIGGNAVHRELFDWKMENK